MLPGSGKEALLLSGRVKNCDCIALRLGERFVQANPARAIAGIIASLLGHRVKGIFVARTINFQREDGDIP
jgi:hypothetical protein